tara:strand:- start:154 stop:702 length:549 start_codon:yes stop_codon:yes gene_type:complete
MKILLTYLILLTSLTGYSQKEIQDSVFIKKYETDSTFTIDTLTIPVRGYDQILVGTTFLPYSDNTVNLLNNGLFPKNFSILEECDGELDKHQIDNYPKIDSSNFNEKMISIDVSISSNCCHNFLGDAEITNNSLNLYYTGYGSFCSCTCLFKLRYTFDISLPELLPEIEQVTINGKELLFKK